MNDSKELWQSLIKNSFGKDPVILGELSSDTYKNDPMHLCFALSRYKFCARMLNGLDTVIEVGIGDGLGSPIIAKSVNQLICTDIHQEMLKNVQLRNSLFENITFEYFNFIQSSYSTSVDGIYLVDVIEHIYLQEEQKFMSNLVRSLKRTGVMIIGTPNKSAKQYASEQSRNAHVNLKDYEALMQLGHTYFENVFLFGMNDEVLHTGYYPMCHYLWILCTNPKQI